MLDFSGASADDQIDFDFPTDATVTVFVNGKLAVTAGPPNAYVAAVVMLVENPGVGVDAVSILNEAWLDGRALNGHVSNLRRLIADLLKARP